MGKYLRRFDAAPTRQSKIACGLLVALLAIMLIIPFTTPLHRWGDSSTYYMQISSISEDFDIEYSPEDIQRALDNRFDDLPAGLFLIKTDNGHYYYGKEYSYALFAAPFHSIFGDQGILLFNIVLFWLMILMGYLYLRRSNTDLVALGGSVAFFLISTAFVYTFWVHPEIYNMFLITAGIFFWLTYRNSDNYKFLMIAAVIFGIATVAKVPNCLIFIPIVCYELLNINRKHAFWMLTLFLLPIIAFYGLFYLNTGAMTFYGGHRLAYTGNYPFFDGYDVENEAGKNAFSVEDGIISAVITDPENLKTIPYNMYYYLFGRFTGMVWYYPFAVFATMFLIFGLARAFTKSSTIREFSNNIIMNKEICLILLGIILNTLFYIVIIGNNYLGGMHAVGNRYFYVYPAFLFLIGTIKIKKMIPLLLVAMILTSPVISDPIRSSASPDTYSYEFPYLYLPIEYSQLNNLPFWSHSYGFDGTLVYRIDDQSSYHKDGFLVCDGTAEFLIQPRGDTNAIGIFIGPYQDSSLIFCSNHSETQIVDTSNSTLIALTDMTPVYSDNRYSVYRFSVSSNKTTWIRPIKLIDGEPLQFGAMGWYSEENWNGVPTRWMPQDASLFLYAEESGPATLQFKALGYRSEKTLTIYHDNTKIGEEIIPQHFTEIKVPLSLQEGVNIIRLEVLEGCDKPSEAGNSSDARCLCIAVQDVHLERGGDHGRKLTSRGK